MSHLRPSVLFTRLVFLLLVGGLTAGCTDRPTWREMRVYDAPGEQIDIPIDNCAGEMPLYFGYAEGRKLEREIASEVDVRPSIGVSLSPEQVMEIGASVSLNYGYTNRTTKEVELDLWFSTTVPPHLRMVYTQYRKSRYCHPERVAPRGQLRRESSEGSRLGTEILRWGHAVPRDQG